MEYQNNKKQSLIFIRIAGVLIIGVLVVAILFPVFKNQRIRQPICLSNIKCLSLGLVMYADENNGYFPTASIKDKITSDNWQKYSDNINVNFCPSSPKKNQNPIIANYGINEMVLPFFDGSGNKKSKLVNKKNITTPSETYLIMDSGYYIINPSMCKGVCKGNKYLPGVGQDPKVKADIKLKNDEDLYKDFISGRHSGGVNLGFCDGHAKYVKSEVVADEANKPGFGAWSP